MFTLCEDADERAAFAANLLQASQPGGPGRVVITLRSDFYPRFAELPAFGDRIASHQYVVTEVGDHQLREIIERPAAAVGASLQPGLADRIINDLRGEAGTLPLLEHALFELWEHRDGATLTHDAYTSINGVNGALARRADATLSRLHGADREIARRLLLALIRPGEGAEDTKQPALLSDLAAPAVPVDRLRRVAATLADARLVTTDEKDGDTSVEVSHEALIRSWPTLATWIDESREDLRMHRRLQQATTTWIEADCSPDLLYRGSALSVAKEWADTHRDKLPTSHAEFLHASLEWEDAQRKRSRRRRRTVLVALASLTIVAFIAAAIATTLANQADSQRVIAEQRRKDAEETERRSMSLFLAGAADQIAEREPDLSVLLSIEAYKAEPTPQARRAIVNQVGRWPGVARLLSEPNDITDVTFTSDPDRLVTIDDSCTVAVRESARAWRKGPSRSFDANGRSNCIVSAQQDLVAVAGKGSHKVDVWDLEDNSVRRLSTRGKDVRYLLLAPDASRLLVQSVQSGQTFNTLVDVSSGDRVDVNIPELREGIVASNAPAFTRNGRLLYAAIDQDNVRLRDAESQDEIANVTASQLGRRRIRARDTSIWISDGVKYVIVSNDFNSKLHVWDVDDSNVREIGDNLPNFEPIAIRENIIAFPGEPGVIGFDVERMRIIAAPITHPAFDYWSASVSPTGLAAAPGPGVIAMLEPIDDGEVVITAPATRQPATATGPPISVRPTNDGGARVWLKGQSTRIARQGQAGGPFTHIAVSAQERMLATATKSRAVSVWDLAHGRHMGDLAEHVEKLSGLAFSADGRFIIASQRDTNRLLSWNVNKLEGPPVIAQGCGGGGIHQIMSSTDGSRAVATVARGRRSSICVWDTSSQPREPLEITAGEFAAPVTVGTTKLVLSNDRGRLELWDIGDAKPSMVKVLPFSGGDAVSLSPDQEVIGLSSYPSISGVLLWDLSNDEELGVLLDWQSEDTGFQVSRLAFDERGMTVYAYTSSWFHDASTIMPVQFGIDHAIQRLCDLVERDLTSEERMHYLPDQPHEATCPVS